MRKLMVLLAMVWVGSAWAAVTLSGEKMVVGFEETEGYALSALVHRGHDFNFVDAKAPKEKRSPWVITIRDEKLQMMTLGAKDAKSVTHKAEPGKLTVVWQGVGSAACPANLTVTMTVRMEAAKSLWHLKVAGQAPGALWLVDFPRLSNLRPVGEDRLLYPQYFGRMDRDPVKRARVTVASYPSPLSMQFMATYGTKDSREQELPASTDSGWQPDRTDATGLYMAAEDGQCYYKRLGYDTKETPGQMRLWIENMPELAQWPLTPAQGLRQVSYSMPYEVVVAAFTGDAFEAGRMYREFAQKQFWCSRGPEDKWPTQTPAAGSKELARWTPTWFRNVGFWAKYYQEPSKIVPEWAAYAKWLQVPMASHYYRGTIAVFDDNYPEMLPTDPYYISGVRDAKDMSVRPLPYTNGVIWDQDTQSYISENGAAAATKDEAGNIPIWDINKELYAYMCPGAKKWRDEVTETAYKQIAEHGMGGVYLDCLTATGSKPCYDASHGHTLHGGNYYGMGQHQMMLQMRAETRAVDPGASFFPEECGEWVIDAMDGFLTLDILRFTPLPNAQVYPLFAIAYHDYTINFGCDAVLSLGTERFAWEMGQMLVWGAKPLNSASIAPDPQPGEPKSEMLRDVVQAYYVAGMRFLQGGEAVRMATRELAGVTAAGETPALRGGGAGLELAARPYELRYDPQPGRERSWRGPAVIASAWRRDGDVGIVMVNITGQEQPVELRIDRERLGLPKDARLVRTWPREPEVIPASGVLKTTLPVRRVAIYVLTTDVARASQGQKLLETPWELLTVENGDFGSLKGGAGTLWACSDGPVANAVAAEGTAATPKWVNEAGQLVTRHGLRPRLREGEALPRKFEEKPFLLLRRLPVRVEGPGFVTVLSGDEQHLSCVVEGGVTLKFGQPGLVAAAEIGSAKVLQPLATLSELRLPSGRRYAVGYARPEAAGLGQLLQTADAESREKAAGLVRAVAALSAKPSAAGLAGVSAQLPGLEQSLSELPGALVPGTALELLHRQVQALVTGQTGVRLWATGEHDWLAPGLTTEVSAQSWPSGTAGPTQPKWAAVGTGVKAESRGNGAAGQVTVTDPQYAERMVPVIATADVKGAGATFVLTDLLQMDANRAMELQGPNLAVTGVAGRETEAQVLLRNWSPFPLSVKLTCEQPQGWQVTAAQTVEVPPLSNKQATVKMRLPDDLPAGTWQVKLEAEYAPGAAKLVAFAAVNGQPKVLPLQAGDIAWPKPKAEESATLRNSGRMVLYAQEGEALKLLVRNVRVTQYTNSLKFRLLGPDLKVVQEGSVPVDQSVTIDRIAAQTGAHFLELEPGSGSAIVEGGPRGMAEVATAGIPLRLYCSKLTRFFYVPQGARSFKLGARDGGPEEGARMVVTAPGGRVALDRDGNFNGEELPIDVRPEEAGKVWALRVEPLQDLSLWLAGDAAPYLSSAPERVVVDRR
ncbi:MAG: DUF6259 domain-containing protein [Armatimonadia bacterium]